MTSRLLTGPLRDVILCVVYCGWSAKLEVGERYIQVWAPDNGRVHFASIITIWGGGTLWAINWRWGNSVANCVPLHFNHWSTCMVCAATSTGSREGLSNFYRGACFHHNMKLVVRVCCDLSHYVDGRWRSHRMRQTDYYELLH